MEKKLTAEEVDYIFNYIASKDIKYYELQVELTDHMVSKMEEFWANDSNLTFHQVKQYTENEFGRNGFKEIESERTKILQKEHKRKQLKMVGEYFKFPKIMISVFAVFLVYKISFYFEDVAHYIFILFGILLCFSILTMFNWYRFNRISGKRFLSIETAFKINNSAIMISFWMLLIGKNFQQNIDVNHFKFIIIACFWVFGILMIFTGRHLTNKVVSDMKKQYQLN